MELEFPENIHSTLTTACSLFNPVAYLRDAADQNTLKISSLAFNVASSILLFYTLGLTIVRIISPIQNKAIARKSTYVSWICFILFEIFAFPLTNLGIYTIFNCGQNDACGVSKVFNLFGFVCFFFSALWFKKINFSPRIRVKNSPSK